MNRKVKDELVDRTLGFPVKLRDVPMRKVRGEWVPDYDPNVFQRRVVESLIRSPRPLTGDQVRFLRLWLEETQEEFAEHLGVTHAAVSKWERNGDDATEMGKSTEVHIRLRVFMALPDDSAGDLLDHVVGVERESSPDVLAISGPELDGRVGASA